MASTSGPSGRSMATPVTWSLVRRRIRPPKPLPVLATWKRARIPPWSSTTPTAWVLVAQSMPAYSSCFTRVLLGGTMGAPSVPGRRAGCSLRGGPTRISLAPVLAPRPVGRRRSHAGPHETSERGGRPTGTEGSRGSLTPTTPCRRLLQGGWTNEFGHGLPAAAHQTGALSDEAVVRGLREGLESMSAAATFPFQPGEVVTAAARDPAHPLHPGHVRGEVVADVFGVSVVLQATVDLMARVGARQPDPLRLIAELLLSTAVVSCIERCKRLARTASAGGHTQDALLRQLVQPAAFHVRSTFVQESLARSLASFYGDTGDPDLERLERWRSLVDEVVEAFLPATRAIDTGLAGAMRFAYDPAVPADRLLEQLRAQRANDATFGLARAEARSLCALAASRRGQSRTLDAVVELLA